MTPVPSASPSIPAATPPRLAATVSWRSRTKSATPVISMNPLNTLNMPKVSTPLEPKKAWSGLGLDFASLSRRRCKRKILGDISTQPSTGGSGLKR